MWAVRGLCEIALVFPLSVHVHKEQAEGAGHLLQISLAQCSLFHDRLYWFSHHKQKMVRTVQEAVKKKKKKKKKPFCELGIN